MEASSEKGSKQAWESRWGETKQEMEHRALAARGAAGAFLVACARERTAAMVVASIPDPPRAAIAASAREQAEARRVQNRMARTYRNEMGLTKSAIQQAEALANELATHANTAYSEAGGPLGSQASGYAGHVQSARQHWTDESSFFSQLERDVQSAVMNTEQRLQQSQKELQSACHQYPQAQALLDSSFSKAQERTARFQGPAPQMVPRRRTVSSAVPTEPNHGSPPRSSVPKRPSTPNIRRRK